MHNLDDTRVSIDALRTQVARYEIPGLEKVLAVRGGEDVRIFPEDGVPMLDYPMALATDEPVEVVPRVLADVLGVAHGDALVVGALEAVVLTLDHPVTVETYSELLGRPATARVLFSVENKADTQEYREARRRLATVAAELAVRLDAEACLTFQLDRVVMRRTGGGLVLFAWFPEWSEHAVRGPLRGPVSVTDEAGEL